MFFYHLDLKKRGDLTPGLQAKSTSVGYNFGPNGPKSNNQLKNAQNAMKTKINYKIV